MADAVSLIVQARNGARVISRLLDVIVAAKLLQPRQGQDGERFEPGTRMASFPAYQQLPLRGIDHLRI